jgi:hypothetical protein
MRQVDYAGKMLDDALSGIVPHIDPVGEMRPGLHVFSVGTPARKDRRHRYAKAVFRASGTE